MRFTFIASAFCAALALPLTTAGLTAQAAEGSHSAGHAAGATCSHVAAAAMPAGEEVVMSTSVLNTEHGLILQVLAALDALASEAEAAGRLDGEHATLALDFLRGFADACHHNKEEQHLLPLLEQRGLTRESGLAAEILADHNQGRALIKTMADSRDAAAAGEAAAVARFAAAAHEYAALLTAHIAVEDTVLFPVAGLLLSDVQQAELGEAFDKVEAEEMGEGVHERFHSIGEELVAHYGNADAGSAAAPAGHEHVH